MVQKGAETLKRWTANSLYFVQGFAKKAAQASKEVAAEIKAKESTKTSGADHMKRGADLFETKPASGAGTAGTNWKSFAEGLGGAGAKIPGYSLGLLKNAITSVGGVILPGWSMRRIGWVAGAGFVVGFFVGKKFGGVHVHLTTPALPPGYTLPPATQLAATSTAAAAPAATA
ncbi:uncharacterized protein ACA1_287950 [Acanthamoeba castellanii str. Neff]|uniref:Uncharacterized protein n=1 Tax=Acanthamoeba castellanii (strain ATCC 30010 / Neff) TaxID=1257118 RepID=L8HHR6_ACACF|nr:uncharacterized protein ACA1_287950 [Acanthamoeba castellanii str. Neff]ELR25094.1 hypothetical protein ACA1_287950 [Acanthamoeba castellanii str. Neff]